MALVQLLDALHAYRRLANHRQVPAAFPASRYHLEVVLAQVSREDRPLADTVIEFVRQENGFGLLARSLGGFSHVELESQHRRPASPSARRIEPLPIQHARTPPPRDPSVRARAGEDLIAKLSGEARAVGLPSVELHAIKTLRHPGEIRAFVRYFQKNTASAQMRIQQAIRRGWIAPGTVTSWQHALVEESVAPAA